MVIGTIGQLRGMAYAAVIAGGVLASAPAPARWMQATSDHFVVIADSSAVDVTRIATELERFDGVVRYLHKTGAGEGAKGSNRVTVYVADDAAAIRKLYGAGGANVGGFYVPRVSGSVAFTPRVGSGNANGLQPRIVLFHEYAHHFLLGNYAAAYPAWFSEGYAEFVSTTTFERDFVQVGAAAQHRAYSLLATRPLSAEVLFSTGPRKLSDAQRASLYARGWLLTHYIMFDGARGKQLQAYLDALNAGTPSIEAATAAFGDLKVLDKALDAYLHQSRIPGLRIPNVNLPAVTVAVAPLSDGAAAMIYLRMQSERGVNRASAAPIYARAAKVAAAYPRDAIVKGWLAEMAYDAGDDAAAEAAADLALAADPTATQGLLYKARVHLDRALEAHSTDPETWREARSWIVKANRQAPDDADALALYYDSFTMARAQPSKSAVAGIERALQLVPQDPSLRFKVAAREIADGNVKLARRTLQPLAYDPHRSADNPAARLIAMLDRGVSGPAAMQSLGAAPREEDGPPGGTSAGVN